MSDDHVPEDRVRLGFLAGMALWTMGTASPTSGPSSETSGMRSVAEGL
ncbi:hypothetical protein ABZ890_46735 [Streptomyces sp. NPDC046984]